MSSARPPEQVGPSDAPPRPRPWYQQCLLVVGVRLFKLAHRRVLVTSGVFLLLLSVPVVWGIYNRTPEAQRSLGLMLLSFISGVLMSALATWAIATLAAYLGVQRLTNWSAEVLTRAFGEDFLNRIADRIRVPPPVVLDLAPVNKDISELRTTLQSHLAAQVCTSENQCPPELKGLRNAVAGFMTAVSEPVKQNVAPILTHRLRSFAFHFNHMTAGKWDLSIEGCPGLTDADVIYALVTQHLLDGQPRNSVLALTLVQYFEWWHTQQGLRYLDGQKDRPSRRLFLLPSGGLQLTFAKYCAQDKALQTLCAGDRAKNEEPNAVAYFEEGGGRLCQEYVEQTLMLHHCLGAEVVILTPATAGSDYHDQAHKILQYDTGIVLASGTDGSPTAVCCLEVEPQRWASEGLRAQGGTLTFDQTLVSAKRQYVEALLDRGRQQGVVFADLLARVPDLKTLEAEMLRIVKKHRSLLPAARDDLDGAWRSKRAQRHQQNAKKGTWNGTS